MKNTKVKGIYYIRSEKLYKMIEAYKYIGLIKTKSQA